MTLDELLDRSAQFHQALDDVLARHGFRVPLDARQTLCAAAATLAIEHGSALRLCFAGQLSQSASALLRLQFEALVRSTWLLYAAKEEAIKPAMNGLNAEADAATRKWPAAMSMLEALAASCPPGLLEPLTQFQAMARHALNSFVHAGLHPLVRRAEGFPLPLAIQQIQCSNGLTHLAYRMLGALTWTEAAHAEITSRWTEYRDCLPVAT